MSSALRRRAPCEKYVAGIDPDQTLSHRTQSGPSVTERDRIDKVDSGYCRHLKRLHLDHASLTLLLPQKQVMLMPLP